MMNKKSKRSRLTNTASSGKVPYYSYVLLLQHTHRWMGSLEVWWDLLVLNVCANSRSHERTELHTDTNRRTFTRIHTHCDTQLLANQMSQNASPRGQTADLGSSAEFICQLEIAHGTRKQNTHTHAQTNTCGSGLSVLHLARQLMILKWCRYY